jgi:hypothetical protein
MRRVAVGLAGLASAFALAGPAAAADEAENRAAADALIAKAHGEAFLTNGSDDKLSVVRHTRSGLRCLFDPGDSANAVAILPATPESPLGDAVACTSRDRDILITLSATRLAHRPTSDAAVAMAVSALQQELGDLQPYHGSGFTIAGRPSDAPIVTERYTGHADGKATHAVIAVSVVGDWVLEARAITPADDPQAIGGADLLADTELFDEISAVSQAQPAHPAP